MINNKKSFVESLEKNNVVSAVKKSCYRSPKDDLSMPLDGYKNTKISHSAQKGMIGWAIE